MSADPEAVVRRLVELFNSLPENPEQRARSETLRQLLDHFAESVEFIQLRAQPDLRDVRGREDFSAAWAEWLNAWESQRSEIEEIHTRDNRVLVFSSAAWAAFNEAAPPNE
jgi:SnoaL-like domain